jgi:predicted anti-sigma-YlaC factor YlaD
MTMTCDTAHPFLHARLDGDPLNAADTADLQAHLETCAACRGLLADLERLRAAARSLGPITPPDRVREAIARHLPPLDAPRGAGRVSATRWAVAAAAVVAIAAMGVFVIREARLAPANRTDNAEASVSVQAGADELAVALQRYDAAVADLEGVLARNAAAIDPATAATIHTNIVVIDRAIVESRAAVAADPQSESAQRSLFMALRDKITVLQTAVTIIETERKS